ncbi:hypothetical protein [Actibacterium ureilyticum]|uniref:hypothetical protein n=1 Tax=Actibacterium ureilyticum TaxID=1590614 RepID=UPI000BAAFFC0|nr:hypothetical protein [Actibacterium ureilyticum]
MPLHVLLPLVVLGIAGITALLHLLGHSRQVVIRDADDAARMWRHHWPEDDVQSAQVAQDGHAALVQTAQGVGLVWALGADTSARLLTGATLAPCGAGLRVRLRDFTAPTVTLHLRPDEARAWQTRIEGHAP